MARIEDGIPGEAGSGQLTVEQIIKIKIPEFDSYSEEVKEGIKEGIKALFETGMTSDQVMVNIDRSTNEAEEYIKKKLKNKK